MLFSKQYLISSSDSCVPNPSSISIRGIEAGPATDDPALPGDFIVWLASAQAEFLRGRFVWANWDVTEMMAMKEKIEADPFLLVPTLGGWPFNDDIK
jgi:hypothetical protein